MRAVWGASDMIFGEASTLRFCNNLRGGQFHFGDGQSGQLLCRISQKLDPGLGWGPNGGIGRTEQEEGRDPASGGEMGDAAVMAEEGGAGAEAGGEFGQGEGVPDGMAGGLDAAFLFGFAGDEDDFIFGE